MSSKTILIVEDDEDIRAIFELALQVGGYNILTAGNGQEALDILETSQMPCLILLDLMMPVMDGWTFAEVIGQSERFKEIPFIVVTAFAENAVHIERARTIVRKPADLKELKSLAARYCS